MAYTQSASRPSFGRRHCTAGDQWVRYEHHTANSPLPPKKIRVILPPSGSRSTNLFGSSADVSANDWSPSTSCSSRSEVLPSSQYGLRVGVWPSKRSQELGAVLRDVLRDIWTRDDSVMDKEALGQKYFDDFEELCARAMWYVKLYEDSHSMDNDIHLMSVAAVFLSCKVADYLPGGVRMKLQHVLDTYIRILPCSKKELDGGSDSRICAIEMDMLCLSGFDFHVL